MKCSESSGSPHCITDKLIYINGIFAECKSLLKIPDISEWFISFRKPLQRFNDFQYKMISKTLTNKQNVVFHSFIDKKFEDYILFLIYVNK